MSKDTYTVIRLDGWTNEQWDELVDALDETVVAMAEDWDNQE